MENQESSWVEWTKTLIIAFTLAYIVRTFFFSPIIVDGPSMLPTLHDRDHMIVNKFTYRINEPERFDIVVFHATTQKDFIKRIIGLPGEHVMVKNNVLYVDGKEIEEPFRLDKKEATSLTKDFRLDDLPEGHEVIPKDFLLVLGDNRGNSTDSRSLGLISINQIVGKASIIYWPLSRIQNVKE